MKTSKLLFAFLTFTFLFNTLSFSQNEVFSMRQLTCGLSQPWEITFGPDGYLWVTEAHSYEITRIDPASGNAQLLIDLSDKKNFPDFNDASVWPQGGLQGFAFHPDFANNPYLYVAYVYRFDGCLPNTQGCFFKTKIVRYNYSLQTQSLSNELIVAELIPGSTDHNGGRLAIGPISENMDYLFYSVGDMSAGHLGNASRAHHGQIPQIYEGKILRYNLVPDGDASLEDSWIPNDNPFSIPTNQNAVWSMGHRNPQGLVISPDGILYESEHGPYSDDEINIIKRGNNYGFPLIMGYSDGNYDGSKAGAGSGLPFVESEDDNRIFLEQNYIYSEPIGSFFPASKNDVSTYYTNDVNNTPPYPNYYLQYPTIAPSGIDYYNSSAIPGWKNSLLVANLKLASVYRLKLSTDGKSFASDTISYFQGLGRFRDLAISADGRKIYVACDTVGAIKGAPGQSITPPNRGCILEFSYLTTNTSETFSNDDIQVIPNPASSYFTLVLPAEIKNADVSVYNTIGEKIINKHITSDNTKFNITGLTSGLYTIELVSNNKSFIKKLIIK